MYIVCDSYMAILLLLPILLLLLLLLLLLHFLLLLLLLLLVLLLFLNQPYSLGMRCHTLSILLLLHQTTPM